MFSEKAQRSIFITQAAAIDKKKVLKPTSTSQRLPDIVIFNSLNICLCSLCRLADTFRQAINAILSIVDRLFMTI